MTGPTATTGEAAPDETFAVPAREEQLARAADALIAHGFSVELLDDVAAARARVRELLADGSTVFTSASETLRLSGIEDDVNTSGRYEAIKPRVTAMDRATGADEIRRLTAAPDAVVGSVAAVTETGALVVASASGSQIPAFGGGAARRVWVVGAQKVVPDVATALRRIELYALPLEDRRARAIYGQPSTANEVLIVSGEPFPGRTTVLLLRQAIGF